MNKLQIKRVIGLTIVDDSFAAGEVNIMPEWGNKGRGNKGEIPRWTAISEGGIK